MYKPTEEELLELGFERRTIYMKKGEYIFYRIYGDENYLFLDFGDGEIVLYPESIEEIKTLIRLFKLK